MLLSFFDISCSKICEFVDQALLTLVNTIFSSFIPGVHPVPDPAGGPYVETNQGAGSLLPLQYVRGYRHRPS